MMTLYQFRSSHFCEKACWALDYKGLPYRCKNLVPGPHMKVVKRLAPKRGLPILVDGGIVVQDSSSIITFLDDKCPDRRLTPLDSQEAREVLEWEEYLDEEIGIQLRLWFYFHTLPDRERAMRFLLNGAPWYARPLFALTFSRVRAAMTKMMNIHSESARQAEERLLAALQRLDDALKERRFLVGEAFSRADLTACALLSPLCAPGKSDAEIFAALPAQVRAFRDKHKTRRFFSWVLDMHRNHRYPVDN